MTGRSTPELEQVQQWADEAVATGYPNEHAAAVDYLFAPGESYDDAYMAKLHEVYLYVEAQPCFCTTAVVDARDGCRRCLVLNRRWDEPAGRGR